MSDILFHEQFKMRIIIYLFILLLAYLLSFQRVLIFYCSFKPIDTSIKNINTLKIFILFGNISFSVVPKSNLIILIYVI